MTLKKAGETRVLSSTERTNTLASHPGTRNVADRDTIVSLKKQLDMRPPTELLIKKKRLCQ